MSTSRRPPAPSAPRPSAQTTRSVLVLLAVGGLLAAGAAVLSGATAPSTAATPALAAEQGIARAGTPAEKAFTGARAGSCLTWTAADASDITATSCADPHLFEVAADVDLGVYPGSEFGPDAPLPGALRLAALRTEICTPAVRTYLGQKFDPYGAFTVGLINPGPAAWRAGERTVACGLQNVGRSTTPFPVTGRVADADQSDVTQVGTCLGIDVTLPTDPVDCARPHASETVALVDLSGHFPGGFPSTADQDAYLTTTCATASDAFTGAADGAAAKGLTVFWDNIRYESWAAGSRRVNCSVGKELAGGGFAPVTGDARGAVVVGRQAAPPATAAAPGPASTPAPPAAPTAAPQDGGSTPAAPSGR
jgi:hypothetical protein